jgi:hypothetical protein
MIRQPRYSTNVNMSSLKCHGAFSLLGGEHLCFHELSIDVEMDEDVTACPCESNSSPSSRFLATLN